MNTQVKIDTILQADVPTSIGAAVFGGFFAGLIMQSDGLHMVIDMGKANDLEGQKYGCYGEKITADSPTDSLANTIAMAEAGSEVAKEALSRGMAIAADGALEMFYRHFKPTTDKNYCSFKDGDNPGSVPPGQRYTEDSPAQTTVATHQAGGPEAFEPTWYLSSTQCSAYGAYGQGFEDGNQRTFYKDRKARVRLVRTIKVIS